MTGSGLMRRATGGDLVLLVVALLWTSFGALGGIVAAWAIEGAFKDSAGAAGNSAATAKLLFFVLVAAPIHLAPITMALGLPAHLLLVALGLKRWPAYAALGAAVGAVFATALAPLLGLPLPSSDPAMLALDGGMGGLGGALAFWAVLRPDRGRAKAAEPAETAGKEIR